MTTDLIGGGVENWGIQLNKINSNTNELANGKADKTVTENALLLKADKSDTYTKAETTTVVNDKLVSGADAVLGAVTVDSLEAAGGDGESKVQLLNNTSYTPGAGEYSLFFEGGVLKAAINGEKFVVGQPVTDYLISQNFEAVGYDNDEVWVDTGAANPNYTTNPIAGSQSLNINDSADTATSPIFAAQAEIWVRLAIRIETLPTDTTVFLSLLDAADAQIIGLYTGSGGNVGIGTDALGRVFANNVFSATPDIIYIWMHYKAGNGANGERDIYWSTTGIKPGTPAVTDATYGGTGSISKLQLTTSVGANTVYDQITVSKTNLGDF